MFTRKQAWRRQGTSRSSSERSLRLEANKLHGHLNRSQSLPDFNTRDNNSLEHTTHHHTTGNLRPKGRCVKFCDNSKVVLIPCREEYEKHGLLPEIWWESDDYNYFKASARLEVMDRLDKHKGNVQCALAALYQPSTCLNDESELPTSGAPGNGSLSLTGVAETAGAITNKVGNEESAPVDTKTVDAQCPSQSQRGDNDVIVKKKGAHTYPFSHTSIIQPLDLHTTHTLPGCSVRAPRDSLRKVDVTPTAVKPFSASHSSRRDRGREVGVKPMHPLALMA